MKLARCILKRAEIFVVETGKYAGQPQMPRVSALSTQAVDSTRILAGEKVLTIEEVLALVAEHRKNDVFIGVDLKAEGSEETVVRLAEQHNVLHRLLFIGGTIFGASVQERMMVKSPKVQ